LLTVYKDKASWLTSTFISAGVYFVLSKISPPTSTYVDHTVESLDEEAHDMALNADAHGWEKEKSSPTQPSVPY
jgi:NCS1 family nucleobase:cation symporter-1